MQNIITYSFLHGHIFLHSMITWFLVIPTLLFLEATRLRYKQILKSTLIYFFHICIFIINCISIIFHIYNLPYIRFPACSWINMKLNIYVYKYVHTRFPRPLRWTTTSCHVSNVSKIRSKPWKKLVLYLRKKWLGSVWLVKMALPL